MDTLLTLLIPDQIAAHQALGLLLASFITALITACLGVGGGALLLAIMATLMPPLAIIPVHGLVQAAANINRAVWTRQHLLHGFFTQFVIGAIAGALLGSLLVVQLPTDALLISISLFILYLTWGPKFSTRLRGRWPIRIAAAGTTLASLFVGASGPLVAAFSQQLTDNRFERVATFSACMSVQHGLKLVVFGALGFAFSDWLGLVVGMVLTGVAGTWVGLNLLKRISDQRFDKAFKALLTVMAVKLLYDVLG